MKKVSFFLLAALLMISCSKKEMEMDTTQKTETSQLLSFRAEIARDYIPEGLKSTVNLATGASAFEEADEVALTDGTVTGIYRYDGEQFVFATGTALPEDKLASAQAFFPASIATKGEGKSFQVTLPATQVYTDETFVNPPMSGAWQSGDKVFRFSYLCTILKVSASEGAAVSGKTLSGFSFTSHEASVCGSAQCEDGVLVMAADGGRSISVSGTPEEGVGTPTSWYLLLPAQTYTGGFELTLSFSDGKTYTYSTDKDIALAAGHLSAMDAFACLYFSGGSGSARNPYRIATKADMTEMRDKLNGSSKAEFIDKYYIQTADIDWGGTAKPVICTEASSPFKGYYDGQGHTIRNFKLNRGNATNAAYVNSALFGVLEGATIKGVTVENISFEYERPAQYSAGIAARALAGTLIEDCHVVSSSLLSKSTSVGAIAGELDASTVRSCSATDVTLRGAGGNGNAYGVGGLVGVINGASASIVSGCSFNGGSVTAVANSISGDGGNGKAGGLVGCVFYNSVGTTIENCSFSSTFTSPGGSCGGIVGDMGGGTFLEGCTVESGSTVTSTGGDNVGGVVGYIQPHKNSGHVSGCVFKGSLSGAGARTGGIAGSDQSVAISDCRVADADVKGAGQYVGGLVARLGKHGSFNYSASISGCSLENSTVECTCENNSTYAGGVVANVEGSTAACPVTIERCSSTGAVTGPGRYIGGILGNVASPVLVNECWSTADVTCTAAVAISDKFWGGHIGGIVGNINNGIDNVLVINCTYYGGRITDNGSWGGDYGAAVGGIVGDMAWSNKATGDIRPDYCVNCFAHPASVSTNHYAAGGIVGAVNRQIVDNCYSPVTEVTTSTGQRRGSVLGYQVAGGRTVNCYAVLGAGKGCHDNSTATAAGTESTFQVQYPTDAQMKADSYSVKVTSSGTTVGSLLEALNLGAKLYNEGGDGIAHHGTLPYGVEAKSWVKTSAYPYPVISGSPLAPSASE